MYFSNNFFCSTLKKMIISIFKLQIKFYSNYPKKRKTVFHRQVTHASSLPPTTLVDGKQKKKSPKGVIINKTTQNLTCSGTRGIIKFIKLVTTFCAPKKKGSVLEQKKKKGQVLEPQQREIHHG